MTDRRLHPGNGKVVLKGHAPRPGEIAVSGRSGRLTKDVWLCSEKETTRRDRQLLRGDRVTIIDQETDTAFVRACKDGYCGWCDARALGPDFRSTHWVSVRSTFSYPAKDMKHPATAMLHFGSPVLVTGQNGDWSDLADGTFLPTSHLRSRPMDVVAAAKVYLGTPYVWAGNSGLGIDCSGLVQAAYLAASWPCPGDSDLQEAMPGIRLGDDDPLRPGDLIFWKGHVAMMTGPDQIIHANAHHMQTVQEPLADAIARIAQSDTGPVTSRLRPASSG